MEKQFGVRRPTLTRALARLKREGFVYASSTRGTFVAERPPHLHRYALVFASSPDQVGEFGWNRFWGALADEAVAITQSQVRHVQAFYGVTGQPDSEGYRQLEADVRANRVAGLVVVGTQPLMNLPIVTEANVPKAAIWAGEQVAGIPSVHLDQQSFVDRSLDWLKQRGRLDAAVLSNNTAPFEMFREGVARRGMTSKPFWFLTADAQHPQTAHNIVRLLMDPDNARRPDALVVADDNLVEDALAGLISAGVRAPQDIHVVTHCNWPWPVRSSVPTQRLGFDARQVLGRCLELIDEQRSGGRPGPVHLLPAVFEDEVTAGVPGR